MATPPRRGKTAGSYRTLGKTYDGVNVVAPQNSSSKRFTEADVRKIVARVIKSVEATASPKPLAKSKAPKIEKQEDGRYTIKRTGKKKASGSASTQAAAVKRARELEPGVTPIVKRERKSPEGKRGTWRKA